MLKDKEDLTHNHLPSSDEILFFSSLPKKEDKGFEIAPSIEHKLKREHTPAVPVFTII